jgi:hypothetical protein
MLLFNCCKKQHEKLGQGYFLTVFVEIDKEKNGLIKYVPCRKYLTDIAFCYDVAVQHYYALDWEFTELGYGLQTNCTSLPDTPFLNYVLRTLKSVAAPSFRAGHIWQLKGIE